MRRTAHSLKRLTSLCQLFSLGSVACGAQESRRKWLEDKPRRWSLCLCQYGSKINKLTHDNLLL